MADADDATSGRRFRPAVPAPSTVFPLKGCGSLDWGMQSRLARIFRPSTSRTVMLAIDHFETVAAACPVPLVMAGGKKLPELDALAQAYLAIEGGAAGVDMGRNIFQSDYPEAMIRAVTAVVHESMKPAEAYEEFLRPHAQEQARNSSQQHWPPNGTRGTDNGAINR